MPTIINQLVPTGTAFAAVDSADVAGGLHSVATSVDRDAIPTSRRKEGMLAYVAASGLHYKLGADLATWAQWNAGTLGTVRNLADYGMSPSAAAADNTTAFQAAVTASADGDALFLPPGEYSVSHTVPVSIAKSVSLFGIRGFSKIVNGSAGSYTATAVYYPGAVSASVTATLTRNAFPGDKTLYVSTTTGLSVGQWVCLRDTLSLASWGAPSNPQNTVNEDIARIESIGSGTVTLHRALTRRFLTTRSAGIRAFSTAPPSVIIDGIEFVRCRLDMVYCVDTIVTRCKHTFSDWQAFAFNQCTGLKLLDCVTESPPTKGTIGTGPAFYFHNCTLCEVRGHVARWCEGAVLRRGSRFITITDCSFEGANTGLATYSGDVRHCLVANCTFLGAHLVWGAGGHFADSFNKSVDCQFVSPPSRAIGNAGSALAELALTYDGRALKASEHGFDNGQAVCIYGTTIPTGLVAQRRYFAIACTYGTGTWGSEFLVSTAPPRPRATVTFDGTNRYVAMGAGWTTGDAVVIHTAGAPSGISTNRLYFLLLVSGSNFFLQRRPLQTATFSAAADTVTLASAAGVEWADGDTIAFTGGTLPAELSGAPTVYYLRDKTGADTFKLATTAGGAAINLSTSGSGTTYAVCPALSAESYEATAEGGTPLALSGTASSAVITTIGEGNTFEGHVIHEAPMNVVHMHRVGGTVLRDLTILGAQDATNGACCFTLSACTDTRMDNCTARNGSAVTYNRVAHLNACFDTTFVGGEFDLPTAAQLFTGGSSTGTQVLDVAFPAIATRASLADSSALQSFTRVSGITLSTGYRTGDVGSLQTVGDESVATALPGTTGNVLLFATALSGSRTVDLDDTNAAPGDWIEVVRTGGGANTLEVRKKSDSTVLFTFSAAPETGFVRCQWTGTAWIVAASYKA